MGIGDSDFELGIRIGNLELVLGIIMDNISKIVVICCEPNVKPYHIPSSLLVNFHLVQSVNK